MHTLQQFYEEIAIILILQVNNWGLEKLYNLAYFT